MLYRQGRPKPIDRNVLEESGAVSNSFIDEVSTLLNEQIGILRSCSMRLKDKGGIRIQAK